MGEQSDRYTQLEGRLVELQSQLAFQEDTVCTLNKIVTEQQGQIERLNEMLNVLKSQIESGGYDAGATNRQEKPPHY